MRKLALILSLIMCVGLEAVFAQTRSISGTVTGKDDGEPIPGVSVAVKGTTVGTVTRMDGKYELAVPVDATTLVFSFVGMKTQEVEVTGKTSINIVLEAESIGMDEVMVVAYGTAKKSSFTGSAATIKSETLEKRVVSNISNALSGQVAGVQVTSASGAPGTTSTIRVRGIGSMSASNAPLYIVDGVPYDGDIVSINPNDIASMTVLKDASANAIYGARGANGVILVTTKSGQTASAKITVDAKWGTNKRAVPNYDIVKSPAEYYETMYKALYNSQAYNGASAADSYAYADKNLLDVTNGGLGYLVYTVPDNQKLIGTNFKLNPNASLGYSDGEFYYKPDDWYEEIFGKGNLRQEYNTTVSGRSDKIDYYTGVGYLDDSGIIENSSYSRYSGRAKVDYQAKKWLKVGTNLNYTQATSHTPDYQTSWGSSGNLFYLVNMIAPIYPMYVRGTDGAILTNSSTEGKVYDNGANSTNFQRAFMSIAKPAAGIENDRYTDNIGTFTGKWYANITPVQGLTLTATIAANDQNERISKLYSRWGSSNETTDGSVYVRHLRTLGVNNQYLANYTINIGQSHFEVLAGYEQYKLKIQSLTGSNDHLYDPFVGELGNAGGTSNKTVTSYTHNYMTEGFLSRIQYDFDGKYFLSGSYRHDASSRFAPDNRWGDFGSVGAAWLISKEGFFSDLAWLDVLKLKVSWGMQGNDDIGNYYAYQDQYTVTYSEGTGEYAKTLSYKGNKDITWETSYAFNTGADFELFQGRLNGSFEFFRRKTVDLLYNQPVPLSSGISTGYVPTNIGSVLNKGIELSLDGVLLRGNNYSWTANFNLTHYKNEITDLASGVKESGIKSSSYIYKIGGSLFQSYLRKYAGVDFETGQALYYVDPDNGDYSTTTNYTAAQLADCGSTLAKVYGGFGTGLTFHGFDVSLQFAYQLGGKIYDGTYQALMHTGYSSMAGTNWSTDIKKAWTPDNRNTDVPRLASSDPSYQYDSDRFLVSSDYLSFNNVTVGYTLPKSWLSRLDIASVRIYVTGDNLGVLSARKGLDPRIRFGTGSSTTSGSYSYSAMRNISGGVSFTF
ncbi:MAG: TonB-dependent receptor [Breznakibacter sp.]